MSRALQLLPSPGIAIFSNLIPQQPISLIVKGEYIGHSYNVSTIDGQPVFRSESETFSMSHRKRVIDARTGQQLCTIRKVTWTMGWKYHAEVVEDGPHLFDLQSHSAITGSRNQMIFANAADHGRPAQIDFKNNAFGKEGTVLVSGVPVAVIERKYFKARTEYHLHITAGLDMFLIVALTIALDDKAKSQSSSGGDSGGGDGGGGDGGGGG